MKRIVIFSLLCLILYSCSNDKSADLSDPKIDARVVMQLGHFWGISDLCIFPDGKKLVTSGWDASVRVWDIELSRELLVFKGATPEESFGNIVKLDVSPDGKIIAAASERGKLFLFNSADGSTIKKIDVSSNKISALKFSPDGSSIVCGGYDKGIKIIETSSGNNKVSLEGHSKTVSEIDFDKDGKRLISAANDSSVIIWDLAASKQLKKIKYKFPVSGTQFSSDGNSIAVNVNYEKYIYIYDAKTYTEKNKLEAYASNFVFNPVNNNLITINGSKTTVWNITDKTKVKEIDNGGYSINISPDAKFIVNSDMSGVEVYDIETGKLIKNFAMNVRTPSVIQMSPTGRFMVSGNSHISSVGGPDILAYALDTTYKFKTYGTSGSGANIFAFEGSDKDVMLSEYSWGDLNFYDLTTGNTVRGIKDKITTPVSISPDGKVLVAKDKQATNSYGIFDIQSGAKTLELVNTAAYHYFSDISPDGKYYVMLTMDFFKVWELPSGKEAKAYQGRNDFDNVLFFNTLADGKYVVGMNMSGYFIIKDVIGGGEILRVETKTGVKNAAVSPDKKSVALACEDWTIKMVDIDKKLISSIIKGHTASLTSVAFTKKGNYLFSAAQDKTIKVWEVSSGKEMLTILGIEKMGEYEGESHDYVVVAPNGRIDGTKEAINHILYLMKGKEIVSFDNYWDKIYTPNLLGKTLGQDFKE